MIFSVRDNVLLGCDPEGESEFRTPEGVRVIGDHAFEHCRAERLVISEGVETIEPNAFFMSDFGVIELPDSLVRVLDYGFLCGIPRSMFIVPDKVVAVGHQAFYSFDHPIDVMIRRSDGGNVVIPLDVNEISYPEPEYNNLMKLILERDYSARIAARFKTPAVARMCLGGIDGAEEHVRHVFARITKTLCGLGSEGEELLAELIRTGKFVSRKNIDKLTEIARGREQVTEALDSVRGEI